MNICPVVIDSLNRKQPEGTNAFFSKWRSTRLAPLSVGLVNLLDGLPSSQLVPGTEETGLSSGIYGMSRDPNMGMWLSLPPLADFQEKSVALFRPACLAAKQLPDLEPKGHANCEYDK